MEREEYAEKMDVMLIDLEAARKGYHGATSINKDLMFKQWTLLKTKFQDLVLSKPIIKP